MAETKLTTGLLARKSGVNRETIRFYQRTGLLRDSHRSAAGYRLFTGDDVRRVIFIRRAKELGFSLAEIRELLTVADGEVVRCSEVQVIARRALDGMETRLRELRRFQRVLAALVVECESSKRIDKCPIIEQLSKGE